MPKEENIVVPRFYRPWPHQIAAWQRRNSGKYDYYFKIWCRQTGKDTDDLQYVLKRAWNNPGSQTAYVGLDSVWITNNIFRKTVDDPPRYHWSDYPEDLIEVKETPKEVWFSNNPPETAQARIKFIGFLNDSQLIGSSYDNFVFSEASLYKPNAFSFIQPIWDQKIALGRPLSVNMNGTPRGTRNVFYELLRTYTGVEDPADFPGEHGRCYVDFVPVQDVMVPGPDGQLRPLYTEAELEVLKDRYLRQFGNLNLYEQEYECKFTTVNAGLVYLGIQQLIEEKRFTRFNLDTTKPVYFAWDISSKSKTSDATSCIVWQQIDNKMFIYDIFEERSKSLVECVSEMARKPYFHLIRFGALPWDSDRSASSETPIEEVRRVFPNINWHQLDKERVDRGIDLVRRQLPNMFINSANCDYLMECFMNYEYRRLEKKDDWAATPTHNKYSHLMDALRYACMANNEINYLKLNSDGSDNLEPTFYGGFYDDEKESKGSIWVKDKKGSQGGLYGV